jgi:hypothetical protein
MSFGEPPYIVDDGDDAMLLVDADGSYSRLPPYFRLAEGTVNVGFDALYSLPLLSTGQVIRFIPANGDYEFPVVQESSAEAQESDDGFFGMADQLFQVYLDGVVSLTKESVAKTLLGMKGPLAKLCAENDIPLADILGAPVLGGGIFSVFSKALTEASEKMLQAVSNDSEQADDE